MNRIHIVVLVFCALAMNVLFLRWYDPHHFYHISLAHGNVGYNVYRYNSLGVNSALAQYMDSHVRAQKQLIDFTIAQNHDWQLPTQPFPVNDTVGYGIILGLLWKITHSLRFFDVQILQILLFVLSILAIYQIGLLLFAHETIALVGSIAVILFLPLIVMNIMPARDIWAYYGVVAWLYGICSYMGSDKSWLHLWCGASIMSMCQLIRPSLFAIVLVFSPFLVGYIWYNKKSLYALIALLITNGLFFWIPFCAYNYVHYARYIVGPAGQDLLEGLGEFPNQWGYQLNDEWFAQYIYTNYGYQYGTPACDDAAKKEFLKAYNQSPWFFYQSIIKRIPKLIIPSLYAIYMPELPYAKDFSYLKKICSMPSVMKDFCIRYLYVWIFLLVGYTGIIFMWRSAYYFPCCIMVATLLSGWGKLPSHIEYRYIIPFYWVLAYGVGFLVATILLPFFATKLTRNLINNFFTPVLRFWSK